MIADIFSLSPYFRNGLLYFPELTIKALLDMGLDTTIGSQATQGVSLDDRESLGALNCAIDKLLNQADPSSPYFTALASDEAYFMLTGKPLSS